MTGSRGGLTGAEIRENHFNALMSAPLRVSCAFCRWSAEGEAGAVIPRQKRHRERRHKIMDSHPSRKSSRHLHSFRAAFLTDADREEIELQRTQRRKLLGIEEAA